MLKNISEINFSLIFFVLKETTVKVQLKLVYVLFQTVKTNFSK